MLEISQQKIASTHLPLNIRFISIIKVLHKQICINSHLLLPYINVQNPGCQMFCIIEVYFDYI